MESNFDSSNFIKDNRNNFEKLDITIRDRMNEPDKTLEKASNNESNDISEELGEIIDERFNDSLTKLNVFKKPVLLIGPKRGKSGKLRAFPTATLNKSINLKEEEENSDKVNMKIALEKDKSDKEYQTQSEQVKCSSSNPTNVPLPYCEPSWSGTPEQKYTLEILKSGMILEKIDLSIKSYYVIGRLPFCDITLVHPTISRYHAILQYRKIEDEGGSKGLYIYDLGSSHGTFWNGARIRPRMYVRLYNSHMIRFGCSQRKYILQAPQDQEEESSLSVTELKARSLSKRQEREKLQKDMEYEEARRKEEEENEGIDWGMAEDADEETDTVENPYASIVEEELSLNDPKKTLRGWFEREGYDLQYQTEEKAPGQFLCWVDLPIESIVGHPVRAEALVRGKKKESVVQCALEACKILDRKGLLRQANYEGRKRKTRNWEEQDFYDSDEDNFLDRTGTIEKRREHRMRLAGKLETQIETYDSLVEKHDAIVKQITNIENSMILQKEKRKQQIQNTENVQEDSLDAYMSNLTTVVLNKDESLKVKLELKSLKKEEAKLLRLMNIARPANLPPLDAHSAILKKKLV